MAAFDSLVDGLLVMVTGGGLGVLGTLFLRYKDQRAQQVAGVVAQYDALTAGLRRDLDSLRAEIGVLQQQYGRCQAELVGERQRNDFLQATIDNVRAGMDPVFATRALTLIGNVIADENGVITSANPYVVSMFHWFEAELVGRNVRRLIPPRFHAAHEAGLARVKATGQPPSDRVMPLIGLTKQGVEFPISLKLEAWKDDGHWFFSAFMWVRSADGGASQGEIPVFLPPDAPLPVVVANDPSRPVPVVRPGEKGES